MFTRYPDLTLTDTMVIRETRRCSLRYSYGHEQREETGEILASNFGAKTTILFATLLRKVTQSSWSIQTIHVLEPASTFRRLENIERSKRLAQPY